MEATRPIHRHHGPRDAGKDVEEERLITGKGDRVRSPVKEAGRVRGGTGSPVKEAGRVRGGTGSPVKEAGRVRGGSG